MPDIIIDTPQQTIVIEQQQQKQQEAPMSSSAYFLSAFGAPSGGGGSSFETMDFSMPSYGDTKQSEAPPAFSNPFPDLVLPSKTEDKQAAAEAKQEAADAKEAAAAKKIEERAARRVAEMEKQKEAVARNAEKQKVMLRTHNKQILDLCVTTMTTITRQMFGASSIPVLTRSMGIPFLSLT